VTVGGGLINVSMSGTNCNAVESDQGFIVNGGALAVTASGPQSKGITTDGDAVFNGGTLRFNISGDVVLETATNSASVVYKDPSYSEAVKASNVVVNAGSFSVLATGQAGRGFSAERDLTVNGGTFAIVSSGSASATFTNEQSSVDVAAAACMKAGRLLTLNGGAFTFSVSGTGGKGFAADAALLATGGTADLDLSGAPAFINHGTYLEPSYCAGVKCGGNAVVSNGTFTIRHTGIAGRGFSVDTNLLVTGGSFAITTTGTNTAVYTSGVYYVNSVLSNYLDVGAASAIKVDGNMVAGGGTFDLLSTGCCGKGLNVSGTLTVGTNAIAATPAITARTTGTQFKISGGTSSGGGRPGGGGAPPDDTAEYSNPKAIKIQGKFLMNSGSVAASTQNAGGEGIESKDAIIVNGGTIEATAYNDGINAETNITFNGGNVFCCSTGDGDGTDSNGTYIFNGGVIVSLASLVASEEGLDGGDGYAYTVNGGTFIGVGGTQMLSTPTAGTQYSLLYTGPLTSNNVMRITDSSGSVFAFRIPRSYSGNMDMLCSCSGIKSSGTYSVYTNASMTTGSAFHGLYTNSVSSASGGQTRGTVSSKTGMYYKAP